MRHRLSPPAATIVLAILAGAGQAAPDGGSSLFLDDLPVVLTASRMVQSPLDAPAPVTIIDREQIEASGFTEIHDLLRLVPGFLVADWPDGSPTVANHGLGDAFGRRIKVLIDGRTVNSPLWGDTKWHELPVRVDDIDHLEVVRGPHGASYGANAFQGVINIITRSPATEAGSTVIARIGADGFFDHGVRLNSPTGSAIDWRISASRRAAENFKVYDDGSEEAIRRDVINIRAQTQLSPTDELRLQVGAVRGTDRRGYPPQSGDVLSPLHNEKLRSQYLQLAWQRSLAVESELTLQYYHQSHQVRGDWVASTSAGPVPIDIDADTRRDDLELQLTHRLTPEWHLLWGAGVRRDAVRSERLFGTGDTLSGTQWQSFASLTWNPLPALAINAGGVLERHHYSGTLFSPRLAVNYALSPRSSLRASTGTSYRAPSFMETESLETLRLDGRIQRVYYHAALPVEAEKVRYTEAGYLARFDRLGIDLDTRVFHERYSRYLDDRSCRHVAGHSRECPFPAPAGYTGTQSTFYFLNSGAFTMQGAEASINWRKDGWGRIVFSQAFIDIDAHGEVSDSSILDSAPASLTSLLLIKELPGRWRASLGYYHNYPMYWLNDGDRVPNRDRFDLKVSRSFGAPQAGNEFALTLQSLGGDYAEFHEGRYRHEPRAFASVRLTW